MVTGEPERYDAYGAFFLTDEEDSPVQLESTFVRGRWQLPGGVVEPGESPWDAAVREVKEELGLDLDLTPQLLLVHTVAPRPGRPGATFGLVFDGGRLSAEQLASVRLDPTEHRGMGARPLADWRPLMDERSWTRLEAVAAARRDGRPGLLHTT